MWREISATVIYTPTCLLPKAAY